MNKRQRKKHIKKLIALGRVRLFRLGEDIDNLWEDPDRYRANIMRSVRELRSLEEEL